MPHDVHPFVNGLVENVATQGIGEDIWVAVRDTLIEHPTTTKTNTVIAAYATDGGFTAREVGMHRSERPLGYNFARCGNPDCPGKERPGHISGELLNGQSMVRIRCGACSWKSKKVKIQNQSFINPLHPTLAPKLFYHTFPSPPGLATMFL